MCQNDSNAWLCDLSIMWLYVTSKLINLLWIRLLFYVLSAECWRFLDFSHSVFCPPSSLHHHHLSTPPPRPALTGRTSTTSLDPESAVTWASSRSTSQLISFKPRYTKWLHCFRVDFSLKYLFLCSVKKEVSRLCLCQDEVVQEMAPLLLFFLNLFLHLQPIFDWNVKQLFLYLSAEYATKSNVSHDTHTHTHAGHLFPKQDFCSAENQPNEDMHQYTNLRPKTSVCHSETPGWGVSLGQITS